MVQVIFPFVKDKGMSSGLWFIFGMSLFLAVLLLLFWASANPRKSRLLCHWAEQTGSKECCRQKRWLSLRAKAFHGGCCVCELG